MTTHHERVEIRGDEYGGWTHTLGIAVDGPAVVLDTYWRRKIDGTPTPVALDAAAALEAAAELAAAARHALAASTPTDEQLRAVNQAADALAAAATQLKTEING